MVPPEGIDKIQPSTLPADFGEWDNGENPETQPADFNGFDRFPGSVAAPKPAAKPAPTRVAVLPAVERPAAPPPPPRRPAKQYPAPEPVFQPPQELDLSDDQDEEDENKGKRTKMFVIAGVAALVLVGGAVGYMKFSSKPATPTQTVVQQTLPLSAANAANPESKPTAATTTATPTTPAQTATTATETAQPEPAASKPSQMINSQLSAPSRISNDLKALGANQAAPTSGFSANGMDMGSGNGVFSPGSGPKVKVESTKKVNISAGIAVGLLIQKTAPVYPPIARSAHVSGTVVLQAMISKSGAVENVRVVSGPPMLRQAAQDAVKNWRYRPYLLDGEPVEVETTVNVVFTLGT